MAKEERQKNNDGKYVGNIAVVEEIDFSSQHLRLSFMDWHTLSPYVFAMTNSEESKRNTNVKIG